MHDNKNLTPDDTPVTTPGRHRERTGATNVRCLIKVFPYAKGLRVHTPHDGSQHRAATS